MKYVLGILVILLIAGGTWAGFNTGNKKSDDSTTAPNSTAGTKILNLSNQGITNIDYSVYGKTDTTDLILSNNSIKTLPSEMGKMNHVVIFKIDHNLLEDSLIAEIRQMSKLKVLDVSYNKMTGMPAEIGQLSNLETLDYSYNKITVLPNELSNLKNSLKKFNLAGNPLNQDQISKLKASLPNTYIIY